MTKTVSISESEVKEIPEPDVVVKEENDDVSDLEDTEDAEDDEYDESEFEHPMDFGQLLSNFFVNENGVNVADAIMELKDSVDIHNKLLHKFIKLRFGK